MDTKKLRQKILDLAIHGKLVPQDPNDEPASVLLERIKAEKEQLIKEGKIKRQKKSASSDTSHYGNDVPFEVPEGWVWCNITEITYKITDGTHHSPISYPRGDYMYVTAKNIKESGVSLDNMTFVTSEVFRDVFSRCNPELGDILYIKDGATTGVVTINDIKDPFCLLSSVALIKPSKSIDRKYLLYYLRSSTCYSSVRESMKGVGITRVTLKQIENWVVPIPPLSEQKRIVDEVEKWFVQIDAIEQDSSDLKDAVQKAKSKILDLALSGRLTSDTSHYPQLPDGWEYKQLEEVAEIFDNVRIPLNANERENRIRNKQSSELYPYYGATGQVGLVDEYLLEGKFLLLGEDGAPFLDKNAIKAYPVEGRFWVNNHAHILKPKYDFDFLMYYLNGLDYKAYASGSTRLKLTQSSMSKIKIPMPPKEEQRQISQILNRIFKKLDSIVVDL